jgi:hypothetical protein
MPPLRRMICFFLVPASLCFTLAGCRQNRDLVEAELRTKDRDLHCMRDELNRSEAFTESLRRELCALRGISPSHLTPEGASQVYGVTTLTLGRGTGGYDADSSPGDEALQVVLEPKDPDGHTIKAPGTVEVQALEISAEGLKTPISAWTVSPDQLRRSWKSGLLSTGYSLVLPWQMWPSSEKVRVVVRFKLEDGRLFEADKDVTVRVAPEHKRRMPPADAIPSPELVPPPKEIWPPQPGKLQGPAPNSGWSDMPLSQSNSVTLHRAAASPMAGAVEMLRPTSRSPIDSTISPPR